MINDEQMLAAIRERDKDMGEYIPSHWVAQLDRRNLLRLLDEAMRQMEEMLTGQGIGW